MQQVSSSDVGRTVREEENSGKMKDKIKEIGEAIISVANFLC